MADPIVFISHSRVREGKLELLREISGSALAEMEATKPGTLLHYGYLNDDQSELSFVHVFPDADAMDDHFVGSGDRAKAASEYIEVHRFEIYGSPSDDALAALRRTPGVDLVVRRAGFGGYLRRAED